MRIRPEGGIDWKFIGVSLAAFVAIGATLLFFFGDKISGSSYSPQVLEGVEIVDSSGEGRSDLAYLAPANEVDAIPGVALVGEVEGISFEAVPARDDAPSEYTPSLMESETSFTGASFNLGGRDAVDLFYEDHKIQIRQGPLESFFINGINVPSSSGIDLPPYLLRQLRAQAGDRDETLVAYGLFDGKDDQWGSYVITDAGVNGSRYLDMYLWDASTVLHVTGPIGSSNTLPEWLLSLSLA